MTIVPLNIGTQSNRGRYGQDGAARLVNCYPEEIGKEGKHPIPVYAFPGLSDFATLTDGGTVRCMIDLDAYLYAVAGRAIYRVDASGTGGATPIGGLPSDGLATMARNRRVPHAQIVIVCDGIVKVITNGVVTDLEDTDLPPPNAVFFLGGYFVFTHANGRFSWSAIDDTGIDALDFASAEANPDGLLIGKAMGQVAVLFGPKSIEFWQLSADPAFIRSHVINVGCFAAGSVAQVPIVTASAVADSIAWAATDSQGAYAGVCLLDGFSAKKISNHSVDRAVRDEPDPLSITSCSWSDGGHAFYSISGSSFSFCFDTATGQWTERESYGLERWKVRSVQQFAGRLIVGDYTDNKLYVMSNDAFTEGSDPLVMTIQTPPVHSYPELLEYLAIYLDVIPGVGLASGAAQDIDPVVMVSWSDDGINFTSERSLKLGEMGQTVRRAKATRLGQSKHGGGGRTFRFRISAAVAKGIMGAALDVNKLAA